MEDPDPEEPKPQQPPEQLSVTTSEQPVSSSDVSVKQLAVQKSISLQIREFLKTGAKTVEEIAEGLNLQWKSVQTTLYRLVNKGIIFCDTQPHIVLARGTTRHYSAEKFTVLQKSAVDSLHADQALVKFATGIEPELPTILKIKKILYHQRRPILVRILAQVLGCNVTTAYMAIKRGTEDKSIVVVNRDPLTVTLSESLLECPDEPVYGPLRNNVRITIRRILNDSGKPMNYRQISNASDLTLRQAKDAIRDWLNASTDLVIVRNTKPRLVTLASLVNTQTDGSVTNMQADAKPETVASSPEQIGLIGPPILDPAAAMTAIAACLADITDTFTATKAKSIIPDADSRMVLSWVRYKYIEAVQPHDLELSFRFTRSTLEMLCEARKIPIPSIQSRTPLIRTQDFLAAISYLGSVDVLYNDVCTLVGVKTGSLRHTKNRAIKNGYLTVSRVAMSELLSITDAGEKFLASFQMDPVPGEITDPSEADRGLFARTSHQDSVMKAIFVHGIYNVPVSVIQSETNVSISGAGAIVQRLVDLGYATRNGPKFGAYSTYSLTPAGIERAKVVIQKEYVRIGQINWDDIDAVNTKERADWKLKSPVRFALALLKDATVMVTLSERLVDATDEQDVIAIESKIQQLGPRMQLDVFSMMIARHHTVAKFEEQAAALITAKRSRSDEK